MKNRIDKRPENLWSDDIWELYCFLQDWKEDTKYIFWTDRRSRRPGIKEHLYLIKDIELNIGEVSYYADSTDVEIPMKDEELIIHLEHNDRGNIQSSQAYVLLDGMYKVDGGVEELLARTHLRLPVKSDIDEAKYDEYGVPVYNHEEPVPYIKPTPQQFAISSFEGFLKYSGITYSEDSEGEVKSVTFEYDSTDDAPGVVIKGKAVFGKKIKLRFFYGEKASHVLRSENKKDLIKLINYINSRVDLGLARIYMEDGDEPDIVIASDVPYDLTHHGGIALTTAELITESSVKLLKELAYPIFEFMHGSMSYKEVREYIESDILKGNHNAMILEWIDDFNKKLR
ncbi:MAG: hypothetical protein IJ757_06460 [Clostridiales bacterium]|nr:hypothetical protein [Clostridiales bacterium]